MQLDPDLVFSGFVQLLILLLALSVHESAHAWTALKLGDSMASDLGRVSLNPIRHLDPVGSVFLPVLLIVAGGPVFGWAKPSPVRVSELRQPQRDHLLVKLAGPVANLALAGGALLVLAISLQFLGEDGQNAATLSLLRETEAARKVAGFPVMFTLVQMAFLNGFLAIFNLLPIPPLDGGEIALHLLPPDWAKKYSVVRPYGFMIVLGLALLNVLALLIVPVYIVIALVINLAGSPGI